MTDHLPFWWRRMLLREGRRIAADWDYRAGVGQPHYPTPTRGPLPKPPEDVHGRYDDPNP